MHKHETWSSLCSTQHSQYCYARLRNTPEALGERKPPPKQAIYHTFKFSAFFFIHCILTSYSLFHSDISSFGLHLSLKLSVLRRCRSNRLGAGRGPKINLGKLGPAPWDRSMAGTPETRACSPCIITPNFVALGKPFESNYGNLP